MSSSSGALHRGSSGNPRIAAASSGHSRPCFHFTSINATSMAARKADIVQLGANALAIQESWLTAQGIRSMRKYFKRHKYSLLHGAPVPRKSASMRESDTGLTKGVAVVSQHPSSPWPGSVSSDRFHQTRIFPVPDFWIRVLNAYASSSSEEERQQLFSEIVHTISVSPNDPIIFCGDLNVPPDHAIHTQLRELGLVDIMHLAYSRQGLTQPPTCNRNIRDYMYVSRHVMPFFLDAAV